MKNRYNTPHHNNTTTTQPQHYTQPYKQNKNTTTNLGSELIELGNRDHRAESCGKGLVQENIVENLVGEGFGTDANRGAVEAIEIVRLAAEESVPVGVKCVMEVCGEGFKGVEWKFI